MAVGAFVDAVVRGFFSYHPPPLWPTEFSQSALDDALFHRSAREEPRGQGVDRGFRGKLRNVRTPFGLATLTSGPEGVTIVLQDQEVNDG